MNQSLQQRGLILRSRTEKPHFIIKSETLKYSPTDVVVKTVCFSIDPVMKFFLAGAQTYFRKAEVGKIFNCFGLAKVIQGNQDYQVGSYIFGNIGTCNYNILDEARQRQCFVVDTNLVKMYGEGQFLYLINNGLAAYAGYEIMSPKQGEYVVVSTVSGATGILLCQLLHKKKIKVIGLTSPHKFGIVEKYVQRAFDYKNKQMLSENLKKTKFKYYFDNVGEDLLDLILQHIEINGKIALCGAIANYSNYTERGIKNSFNIISKRLTVTGLTFMGMMPKINQIFSEFNGVQLKITQIKMEEFEEYFMGLLTGGNNIVGKVIVKF